MSDFDILRVLIDTRDRAVQKNRIAFGNRLSAIERGVDQSDSDTQEMLKRYHERFLKLEHELDQDIIAIAGKIPIVEAAVAVKGCGFINVAKIVALIPGIESFTTVSKLWRFAGLAVMNGAAEKLVRGEKAHYNRRLKTACWLLAGSFLKSNSPYRQEYDSAKEHYQCTHPEWTDGHRHNAAMRKMTKLWLAHLHSTWRALEGLSLREPYVFDQLGHHTVKKAVDYGWLPFPMRDEHERK